MARGRRRTVLHSPLLAALAVTVVLAGCSGLPMGQADSPPAGAGPATETTTPQPTPRPFPDRPTRLDRESVAAFVADCERALVWNERVAPREGVVGLTFDATAENVTATGEWTVTLSVDATVEYVEPESEFVGHEYRVTYVVADGTTRRTNVTGRPPQLLPDGRIGSC